MYTIIVFIWIINRRNKLIFISTNGFYRINFSSKEHYEHYEMNCRFIFSCESWEEGKGRQQSWMLQPIPPTWGCQTGNCPLWEKISIKLFVVNHLQCWIPSGPLWRTLLWRTDRPQCHCLAPCSRLWYRPHLSTGWWWRSRWCIWTKRDTLTSPSRS